VRVVAGRRVVICPAVIRSVSVVAAVPV